MKSYFTLENLFEEVKATVLVLCMVSFTIAVTACFMSFIHNNLTDLGCYNTHIKYNYTVHHTWAGVCALL
jgi:uncharacterized membrane protein YwzB